MDIGHISEQNYIGRQSVSSKLCSILLVYVYSSEPDIVGDLRSSIWLRATVDYFWAADPDKIMIAGTVACLKAGYTIKWEQSDTRCF